MVATINDDYPVIKRGNYKCEEQIYLNVKKREGEQEHVVEFAEEREVNAFVRRSSMRLFVQFVVKKCGRKFRTVTENVNISRHLWCPVENNLTENFHYISAS